MFNGNQCWAALARVNATYNGLVGGATADLERARATWLKPDLEKKLQSGFLVKVKSISTMVEEYRRNTHKILVGFLHEDSQTKCMKTTVYFRADVARTLYQEHNDWNIVQKVIADQLGNTNSRRTANRWVMCGRDIEPEVMTHIQSKPEGKEFPLFLLESNPYLTGKEAGTAAQGKKLAVEWQTAIIDSYFALREQGNKLSAENFKKGYCLAAHHVAVWFSTKERQFGSIATSFTAFRRAKDRMNHTPVCRK